MSKTPDQQARSKAATDNGLVLAYFPNGESYRMFERRCYNCRHDQDVSGGLALAPKLQPPHNICAWGIIDRILHHCWSEDTYGHGQSAHDPLDIDTKPCPPTCLRFTPNDYDFDDRDPPTPDVAGQMMLEESISVPQLVLITTSGREVAR